MQRLQHPRRARRWRRGGRGGGAAGPRIPPQVSTFGLCPPPRSPFPTVPPRLVPMPAQQRRSERTPPRHTHPSASVGIRRAQVPPPLFQGTPRAGEQRGLTAAVRANPSCIALCFGSFELLLFFFFPPPPPPDRLFSREMKQRGDKEVSARQNPRSARGGGVVGAANLSPPLPPAPLKHVAKCCGEHRGGPRAGERRYEGDGLQNKRLVLTWREDAEKDREDLEKSQGCGSCPSPHTHPSSSSFNHYPLPGRRV